MKTYTIASFLLEHLNENKIHEGCFRMKSISIYKVVDRSSNKLIKLETEHFLSGQVKYFIKKHKYETFLTNLYFIFNVYEFIFGGFNTNRLTSAEVRRFCKFQDLRGRE